MKFDTDALNAVTGDAALQATTGKEKKKKLKDLLVRGVPVDMYDTLKENGLTFAGYAKAAVQEKMKRDGLI